MERWRCVCAYDGTTFAGWQSQARKDSVQDEIERRLEEILGVSTRIHGSGRTDAGVHALGQVFHFDAAWRHGPEKLLAAFRIGLPPTIQIKSAHLASRTFHARFQATGKRYRYQLHLGDADPFQRPYCWPVFRPLDTDAMRATAEILEGKHDFRAFTALNGAPREDTVRELRQLRISAARKVITITAEADGFLYKMVRSLVGVLVSVGEGKLAAADVRHLLASRVRTAAVQTAPAKGLFLMKVFYGGEQSGHTSEDEE